MEQRRIWLSHKVFTFCFVQYSPYHILHCYVIQFNDNFVTRHAYRHLAQLALFK